MKKSLALAPLIILLAFAVGCQNQQALAELEEMKAQVKTEKQNVEIVTKFIDELNNHNAGIYDEMCAPEYSWYFPSNSPSPFSRDQEQEYIQQIYIAFPDIDWTIDDGLAGIPIEERAASEVREVAGLDPQRQRTTVRIAGDDTPVGNPAFDVTPARLVTGIITERGVVAPGGLGSLFPERRQAA